MEVVLPGAHFEFSEAFKFQIQTFKKDKKTPRLSQLCTLSLCKFLEWNTLNFRLGKNKKNHKKDKIEFSSTTKSEFIIFAEPKI
jgi:hypothetical protein